jgi:hypothetical protein
MGGRRIRTLLVVALAAATAGIGASAVAQQLAPEISVKPECTRTQPRNLVITVSGRNWDPQSRVFVRFDTTREPSQPLGVAPVQSDGSFTLRVNDPPLTADRPPDPSIRGYEITGIEGEFTTATTVLRVPCPTAPTTTTTTRPPPSTTTTTTTTPPQPIFTPTLTLNPGIGPPGFVATAVGAGWPPGAVTLGWDAGGAPIAAVADAGGNFSVPVLVRPGTTFGAHAMSGAGGSGVTASGGFLVVPRGMAPPLWVR